MLGGIFHFHSTVNSGNSGDPGSMQRSVESDLDLYYLPMSHKKDAGFIMGALINDRVNDIKFDNIVNMYENIDILSNSD